MKKGKILIIEDDKDILRTIQIRLEMEGYKIFTAVDGYEGIYKARTSGEDIIILDLKLPGLPGEEICRELRKDKKFESLPIIMLTAKDSEVDEVIGKVIGATYYMRKPFKMDELLDKISTLLK